MHRTLGRSIAAIAVAALGFAGLGAPAANATASAPRLPPGRFAGTYTLYFDFNNSGYSSAPITLARNGKGRVEYSPDKIAWTTSGRDITMVFSTKRTTDTATYLGSLSPAGLDSLRHPGTVSNTLGISGTWYAVKTG